jgi:iron complex outermembrane receptor protein
MRKTQPAAATLLHHHLYSATSALRGRVLSALLFVTLLVPPPAGAQSELSAELPSSSTNLASEETFLFQEIPSVYGASKYEQKVTEAPSSVTIVTADEIRKYGYRTLADILQSVNGFYITYDRNYSHLGVRGFNRPGDYNTRVLLLMDGHRLNDNIYHQASMGTEALIDVDLIDRVEIIRGPSSSLYGTNAFFGVINVITKRGRDIKGIELSTEIGSYDSYTSRITYGNRFSNGLEVLLSGSFYDSQGHSRLFYKEFNDPATNNGIVRHADDDQYYHLFGKLTQGNFTLQGVYHYREKGIPTAAFGTVFNSTRTRSVDERGFIDLKYEHEFAQQWEFLARLYYDRYYYRGNYFYDYSETNEPFFVLNRDVSLGDWWGGEVKLTKRILEKHRFTLGAELRDNIRQDQRNYDTDPFFLYLDDRRTSRNWAVYLQDEISLLKDLLLNVGIRYDYYDSFGSTINPRLALIYNFKKTTFKVLYGEAFRAPNAFEQFYASSDSFKVNPNLKPETIRTYEIVLERYVGDYLRTSIAGYYYTIDDLISQVIDPADELLIFDNIEQIEAKGLEVGLEGKWVSGLEGRLGYDVQETQDQKTGKRLTNSPQHMVKFNLIIPLLQDKLFAGIEARYLSERLTLAGKKADDYFVTNLTLFSQNFLRGVEISGSIYNLFDEEYSDPGSGEHRQNVIEQDGRSFWVKLKYGF